MFVSHDKNRIWRDNMKRRLQIFTLVLLCLVGLLSLASCQITDRIDNSTTTTTTPTFEVVFVASDGAVLKTETVKLGQSATAPEAPERAGHVFFSESKEKHCNGVPVVL